jgi:hypothetical protein
VKRSTKNSLVAAVLVLLTAGVAIAAWRVSGTGSGTGKAATATNLSVSAGSMSVGDLYPGSTGGDLAVSVTNPNAFPVVVAGASIAANATVSPDNCAVTAHSGTLAVVSNPTKIVAGGTAQVTITDALSMGAEPAATCQGAEITISGVTVTADSTTLP